MAKKVSFSGEHSSLKDVVEYYRDSKNSLEYYYDDERSDVEFLEKFVGYSKEDVNLELKYRQEILQRMCVLEMLAAVEARLRIDYLVRCQDKKKDNLSKNFRSLYRDKGHKASLEDDIIGMRRDNSRHDKARMDDLAKMLSYRHWLAHGRYWLRPKKNSQYRRQYEFDEVYLLAADIFQNMILHESSHI